MIKVAITGNIASGKSTVEKILKNYGYPVIDTDKVAHNLLECDEVENTFKDFDVFENGKISREKLGKIVFNNLILKKKLEDILYPKIRENLLNFFEIKKNEKFVFVGIPLVFEANMEDLFDKIVMIYTDDNIRLARLISRNGYDYEYAQKRMDCQLNQDEKAQKSDVVIYNNSTIEELEKQVLTLIE